MYSRSLTLVSLLVLAIGLAFPASATRLCLQRLDVPFEEGDERTLALEEKLKTRLEASGYEIVSSAEVGALFDRIRSEWGKTVDPISGIRIPEKWKKLKTELSQALSEELDCDYRLIVSVATLRAPFANGVAAWDGVRVPISSAGRVVVNFLVGVSESGWLAALSLWIQVVDLDGESLVFRSAGIEPLVDLSVSRGQDWLPEDQWLRDDKQLTLAIDSALAPYGLRIPESRPSADKP